MKKVLLMLVLLVVVVVAAFGIFISGVLPYKVYVLVISPFALMDIRRCVTVRWSAVKVTTWPTGARRQSPRSWTESSATLILYARKVTPTLPLIPGTFRGAR